MRLWNPREWFARPRSAVTDLASRLNFISTWKANRPLPQKDDYLAFADEGYRSNLIVAACIWEIVTSAAEPVVEAVRIKPDGTATPLPADHELPTLLRRPNPDMPWFIFLERLLTHQQVAGQWFIHKRRAAYKNVVELWPLRPDRVRIVPRVDGSIERYEFTPDGASKPDPLDPNDVIHGPLHPDYRDDYYALAPMAAAARVIDLDNQAIDYLRAFFLNSGQPAGLLKFKNQTPGEERERVRQEYKKRYGRGNWHDLFVIDADVEYQALGASPGKLGMDDVFDQTESRLCAAFGVPAILIGAHIGLMRATFSNYHEARQSLWDETLSPMYRRNGDVLTFGLAHEWGPDIAIRFKTDHVQALQENMDARRAWALDSYVGGIATLNEARAIVGLPARDDGDALVSRGGGGLSALLGEPDAFAGGSTRELLALSRALRKKQATFRKDLQTHFRTQGDALQNFLVEFIIAENKKKAA